MIYTLFERYHYDTDLGQDYNIMVFNSYEAAYEEAQHLKETFKEYTGVSGRITEYSNPNKTYASIDIYDEGSDQWDIIEIEAKELK